MKFSAITENHLYSKAYSKGKRYVTERLAVYILPDYAASRLAKAHPEKKRVNRIGLTVSKKLGGAVLRNRTKRILREGLRAAMAARPMKTGFLIVVAARTAAVTSSSPVIARDLTRALQKLELYA
ncbi:MAG: ribonuclease P protein component [Clostridia bacterium]|nr:ribonuclease P protein component [Clostridia bacterium]